jgi:glycosyltransferase involved in cell wall biosynthesis
MRILFALSGLHRYDRGAEIAFMSIADELARAGDSVTLIGSGKARPLTPYRFIPARSIERSKFEGLPSLPAFRDECAYEDLTFQPGLLHAYRPSDYDVTLTCNYPFTNWTLRRPGLTGPRPPHVFVTQNGDWPAYSNKSEFRFFGCQGLVCTNPEYYERNKDRWRSELIPNGVDTTRFIPGDSRRVGLGLPTDRPLVLMVSALIPSKRVSIGIEALGHLPNAHLVIAGDGPLRGEIDSLASRVLPGRFTRLSLPPDLMPNLYRSVDVFLHLSKVESFGNVFLEAMASGLPIVAPQSSRLEWIVGKSEFLFASDNPEEIASKIADAANDSVAMRQGRTERAGLFSWSKIAASYREFLMKVITSSH